MKCFWTGVLFSLVATDVVALQCYSCNGNSDCWDTETCKEHQQMCKTTVMTIISRISGNYSVVKGCASPSWCDSPYTSIYKNLGSVETHCCTGDQCNSLIIDGQLKPSPRSQASHFTLAHHTIMSTSLLLFIVFLLS
ncbi:urokinase plasminogen activator surface receptor-like [Notechis scutatus]|uniref:Urokinase plasminogen activator surface receptor-like n=1 Tax=Notechis scutatus TaxID=8663 RepID=A0A6J1V1U4_9SAUR|nr:urokinase plasminogen activator surface receptor-like [Notechis scutatus]